MTNFPFQPTANTTNMSPSAATAALNFLPSGWPYSGGGNVRVLNSSSNLAFIAFGESAATPVTTTTGMPILPNSVELFTVSRAQAWATAVGVGTAALYLTPGQAGV